jgi:hypothetical protein
VHPEVELGFLDQAARYIEMGVKHIRIGWDVSILYAWWRENGERPMAHLIPDRRECTPTPETDTPHPGGWHDVQSNCLRGSSPLRAERRVQP